MANDRQGYKPFADDEKQGLDAIKQDGKIDYIRFRNTDDRKLVLEQRQDYIPDHDLFDQDDDERNEARNG